MICWPKNAVKNIRSNLSKLRFLKLQNPSSQNIFRGRSSGQRRTHLVLGSNLSRALRFATGLDKTMLLACATSENVLFRRNFEVSKRRNKNFMSSSSVEQIKSKLDIVTVVSAYVKLEKAGGNWKGRCPFHNEKTPSFFVSPERGSYYCFGCQAKGDIFTFVQEFEGLDFVGALKVLAERAGVELEKFNSVEKSEKDKFYSVLEQAVFFYQKKLSENKTAQDYLKKRGITEETIKNFRIGFAPEIGRAHV